MFSLSTDVVFHNISYTLSVNAKSDCLTIEAQQQSNGQLWKASYSLSFIEELTKQTGNAKKYTIFCQMLYNALNYNSNSVYIDLMTSSDLASLKQRAQLTGSKNDIGIAAVSKLEEANKRFLILTYAAEFDRIHYPLPLALINVQQTSQEMQHTINKLRDELKEAKIKNHSHVNEMMQENQKLKALFAGKESFLIENKQLKDLLKSKEEQIDYFREQLNACSDISLKASQTKRLMNRLKETEERLEDERIAAKRVLARRKQTIDQLQRELDKSLASERSIRSQNRKLRSDLDEARRGRTRVRNEPISQRSINSSKIRASSVDYNRLSRPKTNYGRDQTKQKDWATGLRASSTSGRKRSSTPSTRSKSPFKRFDPTEYVQKQRLRRARSASPSNFKAGIRKPSQSPKRSPMRPPVKSRVVSFKENSYENDEEVPLKRLGMMKDCDELDSHLQALQSLLRRAQLEK